MIRSVRILAFVLFFASAAFADTFASPCPYVVKSADMTKHFVMLTKASEYECGGRPEAEFKAAKALRERYKSSGVYENGDPAKPLWTFNKDWWIGKVYVANDGVHIVHMGRLGSRPSVEAFTIYKNGKPVRTFKVNELVRDESAIRYTTSTIKWSKSVYLDDRNSSIDVETNDGISYSIDLATGKILNESKASTVDQPGANTANATNTTNTDDDDDDDDIANTADAEPSGRSCFGAFIFLGVIGILTVSRRLL